MVSQKKHLCDHKIREITQLVSLAVSESCSRSEGERSLPWSFNKIPNEISFVALG